MVGVTSRNLQTQKPELLTREEEYDLILRARAGDEAAKTCLVRKNKGLIKKAINRYCPQVDWRVLTTAGELAVIKAINKFDLATGNKFSSYLVPTIRSEVRDCFCDETGITRRTLDNLCKISKTSADLSQELGRDPTLEEIAEHSELSQSQILASWQNKAFSQPLSFNQRFDEDYPEWLDVQIDEIADPWKKSEDIEILDTLDQLESSGYLQSRQVIILIARYQGYSNREVGEELGVSGERVRQLLKGAEETLIAFKEGALKLQPKQIKTNTPLSTHHDVAPIGESEQLTLDSTAPKATREPVMERIDASRLGGRIGKAIKPIFTRTQEDFDNQYGKLTHAQEPVLIHGQSSDHGTAHVTGTQPTPENQRCRQLERVQNDWRRHLGFNPVILSMILLPLALVSHSIRGFQSNDRPIRRRSMMSFITTGISKVVGIGFRKEHPRPPNDSPNSHGSIR